MNGTRRVPFGAIFYLGLMASLGLYFAYAAVQGQNGIFARVVIEAQTAERALERDRLAAELAQITNLTMRLSDGFLDLDLLDQQAREVLGLMRADEIVLR